MRKLLIALAVILCASSCSEYDQAPNSNEAQATFEPFTVEYADSNGTHIEGFSRASMATTKADWQVGDKYVVNGTGTSATYTRMSTGKFKSSDLIKKSDLYGAYYPAESVCSWDGTYNVNVSSTQEVSDGNITGKSLRFVTSTTDPSSIGFSLACGVVDLNFKGQNKPITSVEVTSDNDVAGKANIKVTGESKVTGSKTINIKGEISTESAHCMVVLPPGKHVLSIKLSDGTEVLKKKAIVNVKRAVITKTELPVQFTNTQLDERIVLLNEGNFQSDNGQVSYIYNHKIINKWFQQVNGTKIGDTPEDVLYIPQKDMLVISVNWSNIVYFCSGDGKLLAATENVPNCRALCTDGNYVYITSYAHEAADGNTYEGGYVAKIDLESKKVVATFPTGYEPEGIAYYEGKLYVANTGGYAFQESHAYEHTVSVIDPVSGRREDVEIIDESGKPVINLYGEMSQSGQYLCINSPGDYNEVKPATVIFNCKDNTYKVYSEMPCTYNTVNAQGNFFTVGSNFNYSSGQFKYNVNTIVPSTGELIEGYVAANGRVSSTVAEVINSMQNPYCVYMNPYTKHLYATDAASFASAGQVYEFADDGSQVGDPLSCYINPGHMVAITPYIARTQSARSRSCAGVKWIKNTKKLNPNRKQSINDYWRTRIK